MNGVIALKILFVSIFLFWMLYNLPAFLVGLKRYTKIRKRGEADDSDPPDDYQPKVSIIVPVKNEEKVIERLLKALVNLTYPEKEVILVKDGSTDETSRICRRYAENHPSLVKFYHKSPSHGKPSAINYAAKRATGEIIAVYDADTVIEPDVLQQIVPHFQDPETGAVQGEIYTLNPRENLITKLSVLNDFLIHVQQLGKEGLGLFVACLGTHTYIRRKVLEELDYWDSQALGEDLELSVRLTKRGYKVKYVPVRAGVEAPAKLRDFVRQRLRWFRGYIQATGKHLNLLRSLNRKSFDAQLTLLLPMMLTLGLLGYALGICGVAGSQIEQTIGTFLLLLSLSTPVAIVVANPRSVVYAPLLYLNWVLMASISTLAYLHALLRKPLEWTKTEKTGDVKSAAHKGLNICFISCFPPSRGRLAEYSYYLTDELQRLPQIRHIDIIANVEKYCTVKTVSDKMALHRMWKINSPISLLFVPLKILRLKPDVVHFNVHMAVFGRSRLANFVGLSLPFVCRLMGFKTVVTLHNLTETIEVEKAGFRNTFLNRLGAFIATKLLTFASAVTLTVRSYVKILREGYKCKRVLWIPHGTWNIDPTNCDQSSLNPRTLLYIGHSGPYKDLELLIRAFGILVQRRSDVKLIVAGDSHPNYPNFLDKYKCRNPSPNVQFTGYVPEEKLQNLFEKVDVVVLPYHTCTGTSGIAHLASSYAVPIVATDLPEFHELVDEGCGIVLSRHDPEALAERVEYVLDHPNLAFGLRERNLHFAQGRTWSKIAFSFCKLYEQVR